MNNTSYRVIPTKQPISAINVIITINVICFVPWLFAYLFRSDTLLGFIQAFGGLNINLGRGYPSIDNSFLFSYQLLSAIFLHGGIGHLLFNMYALYAFGKPLEVRWGSVKFTLFYLTVGVLANLLSYLLFRYTGQRVSLIGASGAIYGVLLAFGSYYPEAQLLLFFVIPMKIKWVVPAFTVVELFIGMTGMNSGIAHMTHMFGFLVAFFYLLIFFKNNPIKLMYFPEKFRFG